MYTKYIFIKHIWKSLVIKYNTECIIKKCKYLLH